MKNILGVDGGMMANYIDRLKLDGTNNVKTVLSCFSLGKSRKECKVWSFIK